MMLMHELHRRTSKSPQRSAQVAATGQDHSLHLNMDGGVGIEVGTKAVS